MSRQHRVLEVALFAACILTVLWIAVMVFGADLPTKRICKVTRIVTIYGNTSDNSTVRLLRADTTVVEDTTYGVGCWGDTL